MTCLITDSGDFAVIARVALGPTSFWRSYLHSQNYTDFFVDVYLAIRWYVHALRGKSFETREQEYARDRKLLGGNDLDLQAAFFGGLPDKPLPMHTSEKDLSDLSDRNAAAAEKALGTTSSRESSIDMSGGDLGLGARGMPALPYRRRQSSIDFEKEHAIDFVIGEAMNRRARKEDDEK